MFDRFTPEARSALFAARQSAEARGSAEISPDDLVVGVLAVAPECLGSDQRVAVLAHLSHSDGVADHPARPNAFVPFSDSTKVVLATAGQRAEHLGHRWVRSEHILAALLREAATEGNKALLAAGVSATALEASALSRPPADTDSAPSGPTMRAFVSPFRGH